MLLLLLLVLLAPLLVLAGVLTSRITPHARRMNQHADKFPQPPKNAVFGHLLLCLIPYDELFQLGRNLRKKYGSRYVLNILRTPAFNLSDPVAVEALLSNSKHTSKSMIYTFLEPWLGKGLLTSSGALWHNRRKLLTPAFHFRILEKFSGQLEHHAENIVTSIYAMLSEVPTDRAIDIVPIVSRCTLRAICETAMGSVAFDKESPGREKEYFNAIHNMGKYVVYRLMRPWLWFPPLFWISPTGRATKQNLRVLHEFTEKVIAERKDLLKKSGWKQADADAEMKRRRPFLDVLLTAQHDGADLSDEAIRHEVDTFMFEGHDTTSMAISWALEMLGRHPVEQELLAGEILDASSGPGSRLDWDSVSKMSYLDRVVRECLRMRPSVPFISRVATGDIDLGNGSVIPDGAVCHVHVYDLHYHPDHFPDPHKFDPERFLPEQEASRHPFAYIPFSAGPRNCIGKRFGIMEVKLMLATVIKTFVVRSASTSQKPDAIADLVLRPRDGIKLILTLRRRRD